MQLRDVCSEIFKGKNYPMDLEDGVAIKTFKKAAMGNCVLLRERLEDVLLEKNIKEKYFLKEDDIIISIKSPLKAVLYRNFEGEKVLIPNNYIVLRGINQEMYNPLFLTYYLDKRGLKELENEDYDLSITTLESIGLPNLDIEKQIQIRRLLTLLTERSNYYQKLLYNEEELAGFVIDEVIGDNHD